MFIVDRTCDAHISITVTVIWTKLDKHEEAIAGVDNRVDKVAEDGDEVVDLLDLLPLQIEERL